MYSDDNVWRYPRNYKIVVRPASVLYGSNVAIAFSFLQILPVIEAQRLAVRRSSQVARRLLTDDLEFHPQVVLIRLLSEA
jgi:hypothetical protein